MVAIKSLAILIVATSATLAVAAPGATAFALAERDDDGNRLSDLYDEYVAASSTGDVETLYPVVQPAAGLEARGQCPNSAIPKCASLVAKKDFGAVVAQCGNCIKESSLCVEVLPFAKLSKTICRFAKNTLKCSGIRLIGWESHFSCKE
ncbi:hypothetical protein HKX48_009493 [Thoreauomyces humboldtii]|nr:hypothetical protein HKX48_009493 [Thoreauomyces humboldtii]